MTELKLHNPVVIAIEEPEAFTHPQLQHVFIQQIRTYVKKYAKELDIPYQLIIISHSPEIAVSAFEMDFQIVIGRKAHGITRFLNWNSLGTSDSREKLKKIILNTNAELLFADKLIAYEGDSEKLMITSIARSIAPQLLEEKIAYIPVGTNFRGLHPSLADLNFEKILLITDIDFKMDAEGSPENYNILTTNKNIQYLFNNPLDPEKKLNDITLDDQFKKHPSYLSTELQLTKTSIIDGSSNNNFKIVSQGYNNVYNFWPRTLESALVTANPTNLELYIKANALKKDVSQVISSTPYLINNVSDKLLKGGKADFALVSLGLISKKGYVVPDYLIKGLQWLQKND